MIRQAHMFMVLALLPFLAIASPARADLLGQDQIHLTCAVDALNVCREDGCSRFEFIQSERYVFKDDRVSVCQIQKSGLTCDDYIYLSRKDVDPDSITFHASKSDDAHVWAYIGVNKARNMWKVISVMPPKDNSVGVLLKRMACVPAAR